MKKNEILEKLEKDSNYLQESLKNDYERFFLYFKETHNTNKDYESLENFFNEISEKKEELKENWKMIVKLKEVC